MIGNTHEIFWGKKYGKYKQYKRQYFIFKGKNQTMKWEGRLKSGHGTLSMDLTDSWGLCQMLKIFR